MMYIYILENLHRSHAAITKLSKRRSECSRYNEIVKKVIYRGVYASIEERLFHVAVYFKIWRKRSERRDPGFARSEAESAK